MEKEYGQKKAEIAQLQAKKEAVEIDHTKRIKIESRINKLQSELEVPKKFRTQQNDIKYRQRFKYQLSEDTEFMTSIKPESNISTEYIILDKEGKLTIRKGYQWDGATGPIADTIETFRASLAHSALYALMRWNILSSRQYRKEADMLFKELCLEDGVSKLRASAYYKALRKFVPSYKEFR